MATITSDNRAAWQALADSLAPQFPSSGKRVKVNKGKKNLGVTGVVTWHGRDRYYSTRYKSEAQLHLMDMRGRDGFRVKIQPDGDGLAFFVSADNVEVLLSESREGKTE